MKIKHASENNEIAEFQNLGMESLGMTCSSDLTFVMHLPLEQNSWKIIRLNYAVSTQLSFYPWRSLAGQTLVTFQIK